MNSREIFALNLRKQYGRSLLSKAEAAKAYDEAAINFSDDYPLNFGYEGVSK